jgi:chromate transporter
MLGEIARLGLLGFGGVGPQAYHLFVERTRWLSPDEYAELAGVGQALPGANTVNMVAICGDRWFGPFGAVAAVAAFVGPPTAIAVVLAALLARAASAPRLVAIECAIVAACSGLALANTVRVFATVRQRRGVAFVLGAALAAAVIVRSAEMPIATLIALAVGFGCEVLATRRA